MPAKSINRCLFTGNATRDPEAKTTAGGTAITIFAIAVNNSIKVGNEYKDDPMFLDIKTFGGLAEIVAKYVKKGMALTVDGRLTIEKWTAPDGTPRSKNIIIAESVVFQGAGKAAAEYQPPEEVSDLEPF
jgi:single stranded DNA-binding protein (ssb)